MAGIPSGAPSPASSRTRRLHGIFDLGDGARLVVTSTRRAGDLSGVEISAGDSRGVDSSLRLLTGGRCTPALARLIGAALFAAAEAVDQAQRSPQFTRGEVRHG